MRFKKLVATIELLAITSVMSVGFSAWAVVTTNSSSNTATIEVENVINNNDFLEIKNILLSDYSDSGFYNEFNFDVAVVDYAYLYVDLSINIDKWKELSNDSTYTYLNFDINIQASASITSYVKSNLSCEHTSPNTTEEFSSTEAVLNTNEWNDSFKLTYSNVSSLSSLSIYLKYKIVPSNVTYLINALKSSSGGTFTIQAEMKGVNS